MQIYLAKPGGHKEGPYSLEQVQRDLATGRIGDSEFWAWHEGLPQWMPLYEVPGLGIKAPAAAPVPTPAAPAKPKPVSTPASRDVASQTVSTAPTPVAAEPAEPAISPDSDFSSGLPFSALEQIFVFTTGEGRAVFESEEVVQKLQNAVGQDFEAIRGMVAVDVIGQVDVGFEVMTEGSIPHKAWRAMAAIRPFMTQKAREGSYQICVRPFPVETRDSVALFLLYNKEQCEFAVA